MRVLSRSTLLPVPENPIFEAQKNFSLYRTDALFDELCPEIDAEITAEAVEEMSKCIAERYGEYSSHDCALLAIESLLNVDDALSWLPLMAKSMEEVRGTDEQTQLACIFVNLCKIRHLVLRASVTTDDGIIGATVPLSTLEPADVLKYVRRFNRLSPSKTAGNAKLVRIESQLQAMCASEETKDVSLPCLASRGPI